MGFKTRQKNMTFSDLEGTFTAKKNISKETLMTVLFKGLGSSTCSVDKIEK
jgi:hypothetical protein